MVDIHRLKDFHLLIIANLSIRSDLGVIRTVHTKSPVWQRESRGINFGISFMSYVFLLAF